MTDYMDRLENCPNCGKERWAGEVHKCESHAAKPLPETHTAQILATALRACELLEMADKAACGYYHNFLSPLDMPELALIGDLLDEAVKARNNGFHDQYNAIVKLRLEVIDGKHDASKEESNQWAASPEGQFVLQALRDFSRG